MLRFITANTQYLMPLDSLDLNFLSQYVQNPRDERIIWSRSVEEEAYYEVEIVTEEQPVEDAFIETCECYKCCICNIDVPKKYYKQHNRSASHQNYKKLVEKVLENVKKQISIDIDSKSDDQEHDMFYCETCCKVVAQSNKQNHKKSDYHKQSLETGQLTSKFIDNYIGKEGVDYEIQSENDNDSEFNRPSGSNLWNPDPSMNNNKSNIKEIEDIKYFQRYMKDMVAKYKLNVKLPSLKGDLVVIVTPKGQQEYVTTDVFHSYKKMGEYIFCLLCRKWVQGNRNQHSVSEEHVRNIFQPVNNNFARVVVNDTQYSHCLICNERFLTASDHVNIRPKHNKYVQQSDTSRESFPDGNSGPTTNEELSVIHSAKTSINSTLPNNTDLEKKWKEYRNQFIVANANTVKCLVCLNVNMPYVKKNIIEHVQGKLHGKACTDLATKNCLTRISLSEYYCHLCKLSTNDFLNHIKSHDGRKEFEEQSCSGSSESSNDSSVTDKDKDKLQEYSKQFAIVNINKLKCLVCPNIVVPNTDYNIITHIEGKPHSKAYVELVSKNSLTKISFSMYYCNLCKKTTDDFLDHIKLHIKNKPTKHLTDNKKLIIKYVYEDRINSSPEAMHYRKIYKDRLVENQIERISNKLFMCKICSLTMTRISEIGHMFGERHRVALASTLLANS